MTAERCLIITSRTGQLRWSDALPSSKGEQSIVESTGQDHDEALRNLEAASGEPGRPRWKRIECHPSGSEKNGKGATDIRAPCRPALPFP